MELAIGKQLTAEQRLIKAVGNIMAHDDWIAISSVLMVGSRKVDETTKTASTDGRNEKYGREFVDSLSDPELRFLILHEAYHKMYMHLTTWKHLYDVNHKVANNATDYVINIQLVDADPNGLFIRMPKCGLIDPRFRNMSAGEVFKILMDERNNDDDDDDGDGDDDDDEGSPGDGAGQGGNESDGFDEHEWDNAADMSEEEQADLKREIETAVRQGLLSASRRGSGGLRALRELVEPKIDWRAVLRDFVKSLMAGKEFSTWAKPNRRYLSQGIYMPSGVSEKVGDLVIGIDTSGSISDEYIRVFLSEVAGICSMVTPAKVHLMYWDTKVAAHEVYSGDRVKDLARSTKPAGGGGTAPACVARLLDEKKIKAEAVIMFTDGEVFGDWGKWSVPTLWCITSKSITSPVGKSVYVQI